MSPDEDESLEQPEVSDWGVSVSNNPDRGPIEAARTATRRLWEHRDSLL